MSTSRFKKKLMEQLQFLQSSCQSYDGGVESEAFRIALALRVIFHKTNRSTPLMTHLGMENWEILSSTAKHEDFWGYVSIRLALGDPRPMLALPRLGNKFAPMPASKWWNEQPVCKFAGQCYTRRDVVLAAANRDGGAHVDDTLDAFYEDLVAGFTSLGVDTAGLKFAGQPPYDQSVTQYCQNTHVAMIRQFGHEVLCTATHFKWKKRLSI